MSVPVAPTVATPAVAPHPSPERATPRTVQPARRSEGLLPQRLAARVVAEWLPALGWRLSRTGRTGLAGLGLLIAAGAFYASTHVPVAAEVGTLREELASARREAALGSARSAAEPGHVLRALPARTDMPAVLGVLIKQAEAAHLSLDAGKYEMAATKSGEVVRYKLSFPVTGQYPQIRAFLDATLVALPAAAISELSFERKSVGDPTVEANIRLTVFTRAH
ncbi:MAG: hypothetical protein JSR54_07540 [Proteobacteria bacterium]|nr:hypothetical protein [Pseudomonadota bacterium]